MNKKYKYYDKHGKLIKAGDVIRHEDDWFEEIVVKCGDGNLGINATKPAWREIENMAYPLSEFDLREWEIIKRIDR